MWTWMGSKMDMDGGHSSWHAHTDTHSVQDCSLTTGQMCVPRAMTAFLHCPAVAKKHLSCVQLLVQNGADVNCQTDTGLTPLMQSTSCGSLTIAQYLLEQKADIHYRVSSKFYDKNTDALHWAISRNATNRTPGFVFVFLSCDTDAKNVVIRERVTPAMRDAHIEEYKHVQAFIDEHHRILNLVLSDHVQVDTRMGGDYGIYQEPLERTLEYLGLSMSKDQVVNTSIDGDEGVRRALIPGHLLNANHWFDKYTNFTKEPQLTSK
jgi:hypothetical protein